MAPEVHSTGCRKSGQSSSGPCLLALTAEKPENGFEGVSSDRREPKAISSPSFPQCGLDEVSADSKFKMFWKAEPLYLFMTQYSLSGNRDLLLQLLTIVRHSEQTKFNWMSQKK